MCGIAGIQFKTDVPAEVLDHARDHFAVSLRHRGPDGFGTHRTARSVFANVRLAIVDRSGGDQSIYAADGQRGIVYIGEDLQCARAVLSPDVQGATLEPSATALGIGRATVDRCQAKVRRRVAHPARLDPIHDRRGPRRIPTPSSAEGWRAP